MKIFVISPFLSTHRNDRKWLRITKIITWQKSLYTYIVNTVTPNYRIGMICRNSPMVHEHIEQPGILPILSENKQAPQQCQPLWTKALSNLINMEEFLIWIWGIWNTKAQRYIWRSLDHEFLHNFVFVQSWNNEMRALLNRKRTFCVLKKILSIRYSFQLKGSKIIRQ